ncbi:hypothetical protein CCH79_00014176 [Gambusia affinis]|uniref:ENTH domain-containing protein n=1 Tax=Gambusia affinis TaxID=33528 RepID=A0A315WD58_GAMAF|nr:hypothetical protein CCH79_00014176 [Gambusia affinis]
MSQTKEAELSSLQVVVAGVPPPLSLGTISILTAVILYPQNKISAGITDGFHSNAGVLLHRCLGKQFPCSTTGHWKCQRQQEFHYPRSLTQSDRKHQVYKFHIQPETLSSSLMYATVPLAVILSRPDQSGASSFQSAALQKNGGGVQEITYCIIPAARFNLFIRGVGLPVRAVRSTRRDAVNVDIWFNAQDRLVLSLSRHLIPSTDVGGSWSLWWSYSPPPLVNMTSSMLRRQLKNLVQNYSEAEVKVREATSNDPWGPSSSQMADISDLTYNAVACNEIMTMLWKRLKDDKNWRHIHKSLTLLEYLLKTGDDRVMLKMKENIYIVKALTEYRFVEKDGKDQGVNVREKAKVVLVLMEDDEKLKEEREFAVKTREKTSKGSAASSTDNVKDPSYKPVYVPGSSGLPCLDNIPSVADLTASFAARKEERLRQEAEKKEAERRAKMSEDELKWEDAKTAENAASDAWGGKKEEEKKEEVKSDPWGAPKEPSTDPWGAPAKTEDPFVADKTDEDPFIAPKDKPDPFSSSNGDPFSAPKDDPFNAPKDDPFNAPKDDPFNAPKDDPFNAPKDDPFNAPKDDPFNAPKDDPFNAPIDDPFNAPKDDQFKAPNGDPFSTPENYPFSAPKDDPFNAPKDDPFEASKDDPFTTPKDDPFGVPANDPFTAPLSTPPKEEPLVEAIICKADSFTGPTTPPKASFSSPTKLVQNDLFGGPTTPGKEDPFSTTSRDDPFTASSAPSKEDPFTVPCSPPTEAALDPFSAPAAGSPQETADTWGAHTSSPPDKGSDAWGAPSVPKETKSADPWGDDPSVSSPLGDSDPFGDATKPDDDPWGAPASAPVTSDDAWGTPAPPADLSPSGDPFGATKSNDPWGAPSNASGGGAGSKLKKQRGPSEFITCALIQLPAVLYHAVK